MTTEMAQYCERAVADEVEFVSRMTAKHQFHA
jgi:hypothetical protein